MADALLMVDARGCLVGLNHAARALLCLDDASIVLGQPLDRAQWGQWPLGAREITERLAPMIKTLQRGDVPPEAEVEAHIRDKGRRVLSFTGRVLSDAHGVLTGSVVIVRDVTGLREMEELKDEMLLMASHDLKTPLTLIRTDAQQLRRHIRTGSASLDLVDDGLASIVGQTQRLSRLLSRLLDLSSIEAGRFSLDRRLIDLRALASTAATAVQATTDRHRIRLGATRRVQGYWDELRLQQVLGNLLENAVKYSPHGGAIDVSIRAARGKVTVGVRDDGVGLAPEEAPHVFERFFRASKTRRLEGTGLGLFICQTIVTAHGGRIWVESRGPGQGSSFNFVLPRGEPAAVN
jgi:signal transduction histidine kinase